MSLEMERDHERRKACKLEAPADISRFKHLIIILGSITVLESPLTYTVNVQYENSQDKVLFRN